MFTQGQIEYIQKQQARGLNNDAIKNKLLDAGWEEGDIIDGFKEVERISGLTKEANSEVVPNTPNTINSTNVATPEIVEKKGSAIKIIIISLVFIILLGGLGFAFYKFVYPQIKIDTKVEGSLPVQMPEEVNADNSSDSNSVPEQNTEIPPLPNLPGDSSSDNINPEVQNIIPENDIPQPNQEVIQTNSTTTI